MTNPVAVLQIDLARLQLFSHRVEQAGSEVEEKEARAAQAAFDTMCARLHHVGQHGKWIYPETLSAIADAMSAFPIRTVYERARGDLEEAELLRESVARRAASMREFAEYFRRERLRRRS